MAGPRPVAHQFFPVAPMAFEPLGTRPYRAIRKRPDGRHARCHRCCVFPRLPRTCRGAWPALRPRESMTAIPAEPSMALAFDEKAALDASTLLAALKAVRKGDFSVRLPETWTGLSG